MENIVIIGAGPAGISAALYAARGNMNPLVINNGIGALEKAEKIENYYGLEQPLSGKELYSQLLEQCQILREYAQYVAKVREYAGSTDLDTAVEQAVNDCIQSGILAEFLRKNKSEVIAMSIFEYDKEEEERKLRKAEYEAGLKEGELQKAKETAMALNKMKFPLEKIAEALQTDEVVIQEWISSKS